MKLREQKGSALTMVLMIFAIMSTLGAALLWITYNVFDRNVFLSDMDKAYYAAEAGIEQVAVSLDQKVAELQEAAHLIANSQLQQLLEPIENSPIRNDDGSINTSALQILYDTKYTDAFYSLLNEPLGFFANIGSQENLKYLIGNSLDSEEASIFINEEDNTRETVLISASYEPVYNTVTVITQGNFYRKSKATISKKISVTFSLLSDPSESPYQVVAKTNVKKLETPTLLTKALVTEKNIISAGGTVDIKGDVLCFGTVPSVNNIEDQNAKWYMYGGLMAGIPDVSSINMDDKGMTFGSYFDFDTDKTGNMLSGSFNVLRDTSKGINGDVSTMSYVHTLYGSSDFPSVISIQGKTFARSIKAEEPAVYSSITLFDTYTSDNLQVDADMSLIDVKGAYYGFVTASYDIDGSGLNGENPQDEYQYKRTSSVVVNGDSRINLNGTSQGGVYIGGSTFFKNFVDTAFYPGESRPYMTGISALKSGSRLPYAYKEQNAINGETRLYTGEGQFLLGPDFSRKSYSNITDIENITSENMLDGINNVFKLSDRANHFKWLWEDVWKQDDIYSRYIDLASINVSCDSDQKINGYAYGNVAANGKMFGKDDFKGSVDSSNFGLMQKGTLTTKGWIQSFHDQIQPLLTEGYDITKPKLDYVENTKYIFDYIDSSSTIDFESPQVMYSDGFPQGVMYVGSGDIDISYSSGNWKINGEDLPLLKGIIVIDGNIYVHDGFEFTGVLLSTKNIVFLGNAKLEYDNGVVEKMMLDPKVSKLFKQVRFFTDNDSILGQRISKKNIKVANWIEVR